MGSNKTKHIQHFNRSPNVSKGYTHYHGNGVWKKQAAASSGGCLFAIVLMPFAMIRSLFRRT